MKGLMVLAMTLAVAGCNSEAQQIAAADSGAGVVTPASEKPVPAESSATADPAEAGAAALTTGPSVDAKKVATCAAEENSVVRLSCYDALATVSGLAPRTERVDAPKAGAWYVSKNVDPLNDQTVHFAMLDSNTGRGRYGGRVSLTVRCKDNLTELYINWNSYLGNDRAAVTHRVDKDEAVRSQWALSTDRKAAFFPGSPVPTLKRLVESSSFVANVTPYGESPVTATFDTAGADVALAELRKACNW